MVEASADADDAQVNLWPEAFGAMRAALTRRRWIRQCTSSSLRIWGRFRAHDDPFAATVVSKPPTLSAVAGWGWGLRRSAPRWASSARSATAD